MSFTLIATRSMPMVSWRSAAKASLSLVPTPSVPDTSTGCRYFFGISNSAPAAPDFDNYVAGPNAEALASVRRFAAGELREAVLYLWGEPGSGRSHLLRAAATA